MSGQRQRLDALLAQGLLTPQDHAMAVRRLAAANDDHAIPDPAPVPPAPPSIDPPPDLSAAGGRAGDVLRHLFSGDMPQLWMAAAIAAAITGVVAVVLAAFVGDGEAIEEVSLFKQLYLTFTGAAPISVHAAITGSIEGSSRGAQLVANGSLNLPLTSLSVLLLGGYAVGLHHVWARQPAPSTAKAAAIQIGRAALAFGGVLVLLSVLARGSISQTGLGGQVVARFGVSPLSTLFWACLLGAATATVVVAARLTAHLRALELPPLAREAATAVRGAVTSGVLLAVVGVLFAAALVITDPSESGLVAKLGTAAALLPTLVFAGSSLAVGIPFTIDGGEFGDASASQTIGLFATTPGGPEVPLYAWAGFALAMSALIIGGLAATWSASRQGLPTTRVGAAQGAVLAIVWLPLTQLFSAVGHVSANGSGSATRGLEDLLGAGSLEGGVAFAAGVGGGHAFLVLLLVGGALGWVGSLLAAPLWGKLPPTLFRLLGGAPVTAEAFRDAAAAAQRATHESAQRLAAQATNGWQAEMPQPQNAPAVDPASTAAEPSPPTQAPDVERLRQLTEAYAQGHIGQSEFLQAQARMFGRPPS